MTLSRARRQALSIPDHPPLCDPAPVAEPAQNWRLDVPPDRIDLYLELSDRPRPLTAEEGTMLVELVDAWRMLEQRKHLALERALEDQGRP